jgi:hypothetical protein
MASMFFFYLLRKQKLQTIFIVKAGVKILKFKKVKGVCAAKV